MDFKKFFANKINLACVIMLGVSIVLLILANFVPQLMGVSVIVFGVTCGFGVPVVRWVRKANDNSAALDNIQLSQKEAKQITRDEKSSKLNYIMIMTLLVVFCVVLVYTGIAMLLV